MIFDEPYFAYSDVGEKHTVNTSFLTYEQACELNAKKYAIAIIPNIVVGGRHDKNVTKIRAWYCDIDYKGPKPEIDDLMQISPLIPSYIVESANGFHIYWLTNYQFEPCQQYRNQQQAIIDYFGADESCKNYARLLRAPGFMHNKGEPYEVKIVFDSEAKYSIAQIDLAFPYEEPEEKPAEIRIPVDANRSDNIFDKIRHYNSLIILRALSGTSVVGFKQYKFLPKGKGHYNIQVDNKDSGCFINERGNVIGADEYSGGAVEWLKWYGHSRLDAAKLICEAMKWEFKL